MQTDRRETGKSRVEGARELETEAREREQVRQHEPEHDKTETCT